MTPSSPPWVRDRTGSSSLSKYPSSPAGTTSRMMSWRNGSTDSSSQVCDRFGFDSRWHASCVSVNVIDGNSCPGDFLCVVSVFAHGIQVIIAYSWVFGCNQILLTCMSVSICDQRFSLIGSHLPISDSICICSCSKIPRQIPLELLYQSPGWFSHSNSHADVTLSHNINTHTPADWWEAQMRIMYAVFQETKSNPSHRNWVK